jgi:hypothetical protein
MMTIKAENWLGEFVSTIGTGDAILGGAIDGFAGFSNVGDDVDVYYTIMDGLDKETGIGTLSAGKLIRKEIHATLVSGIYVKNGSPLNLSGDAQVYGTANSKFLSDAYAFMAVTKGNAALIKDIQGLQINGHTLTASFNLTANDVSARPNSWTPSADDVGSYSKAAADTKFLQSQSAEPSDGLLMRVGGTRDLGISSRMSVVEGKVATLEQRKSTCLVNATGTGAPHETVVAQLPDSVAVNSRYVLPNPFGVNTPVECWAEVFTNNRWSQTGFIHTSGGVGVNASYVQGEGIVAQTGGVAVVAPSVNSGSGHSISAIVMSARCRVFVRKLEA